MNRAFSFRPKLADTLKNYSAGAFISDARLASGVKLRLRKVLAIDATELNAIEDIYEKLHARGKHLVLSGPHTQPLFMMDKAGFLDHLGRENVGANIHLSLERSREILGLPPVSLNDPLNVEKQKIEVARREPATAFGHSSNILNVPSEGKSKP
jgi:SulP family sulfate permease